MSNLLLTIAVVSTFGAVLLLGVSVRVSAVAKRPGQVLEQQLRQAGVSLRQQELQRSFSERVLGPLMSLLANVAGKLTPGGTRDRIATKLVLAGSPDTWDAERVLAFKGLALLIGGGTGFAISSRLGGAAFMPVLASFLALMFFLVPGAVLGQSVARRQEAIRRALPDTMDLLTISVEAGLGFDAALLHVRRTLEGPLSQEFGWMLHEMQLGVSRADAFRHMSNRTNVGELKGFVLAMIQADVFGVPIANVLRTQAIETRTKRRQRAEERAMKIPIKLLFPMLFCILPALFVVLVGPGIIQVARLLVGPHGVL
jgi:tight adherence protein C